MRASILSYPLLQRWYSLKHYDRTGCTKDTEFVILSEVPMLSIGTKSKNLLEDCRITGKNSNRKTDPSSRQKTTGLRMTNGCFLMWILAILFYLNFHSFAQLRLPRLSQSAKTIQTIGVTLVTVEYHRPGVKGREIWGKLVPYNKVWRAGANEATNISFSEDVLIEGKKLQAGTYAFFVIPSEKEWIFIFNTDNKQWGAFNYRKEKDALRVLAKVEQSPNQEWLKYGFNDLKPNSARMFIHWENVRSSVEIIADAKSKNSNQEIRTSPFAAVSQTIGLTDITVTYHRPGVKNREIWGKLVPFGKVWRAGANDATTITFSDDVLLNRTKLKAGTYAFFIIPTEKEWTFIFNSESKQWGAFTYKKEKDVLRIKVTPKIAQFEERLSYNFSELTPSSSLLYIHWEKLVAGITINVEVQQKVFTTINTAIANAKPDDWRLLATCARYCLENNCHLDSASIWIEKSIAIQKNYTNLFLRAQFLARVGKTAEAISAAEEAIQFATTADATADTSLARKLIEELRNRK